MAHEEFTCVILDSSDQQIDLSSGCHTLGHSVADTNTRMHSRLQHGRNESALVSVIHSEIDSSLAGTVAVFWNLHLNVARAAVWLANLPNASKTLHLNVHIYIKLPNNCSVCSALLSKLYRAGSHDPLALYICKLTAGTAPWRLPTICFFRWTKNNLARIREARGSFVLREAIIFSG